MVFRSEERKEVIETGMQKKVRRGICQEGFL